MEWHDSVNSDYILLTFHKPDGNLLTMIEYLHDNNFTFTFTTINVEYYI